jgi:hypothetical protein
MRSKFASFFLLLIFCYNLWGYLFSFHYLQSLGQEEFKTARQTGAGKKKLKILLLDRNDHRVRWVKANEFIHEGYFYDIVKTEVRGDLVCYYVFEDKKESSANECLEKHLDNVKGKNSRPDKASKSQEKEYTASARRCFLLSPQKVSYYYSDQTVVSGSSHPAYPPPRPS